MVAGYVKQSTAHIGVKKGVNLGRLHLFAITGIVNGMMNDLAVVSVWQCILTLTGNVRNGR